ncbi:uncharacterized protein LOC107304265 [Oryza brachyantha]|uniref:Uncharacterized protein n=1 Tax=Oryza brachyantha TaxID=4533 RepID=J3M788_ORYBR|nr:uncharacterized protein LOC107304265 [Oryza brachyantha]
MASFLSPPTPLMMTRGVSHNGGAATGIGGSYGSVIVALAIIATLTVASVAVGQLCVRRYASIKPGYGMGAFVKRKIYARRGGGGATYDVALPEKKGGGDVETAIVMEEVEGSEPPQVEEDDEGGASRASS